MAWSEWEHLKAGPGGSPGGNGRARPDLVARQDDLGEVGHAAFTLHSSLTTHANITGHGLNTAGSCTTSQAAAALKRDHFTLGPALETTVTRWTSQLNSLLQACAHISDHLDHTKASHAQDDAKIKAAIRGVDAAPPVPVSRLTQYFK